MVPLPHRMSLKCFLQEPINSGKMSESPAVMTDMIPLFHRWIREKTLPGLLLDVADYRHVPNGPGVMLVGHEADYGLDFIDGKPGLLCTRKRLNRGEHVPASFADAVTELIDLTKTAVSRLSLEKAATGTFVFQTRHWELMILDRLHHEQGAAGFEAIREAIQSAFETQWGAVNLSHVQNDQREALTLTIKVENEVDLGI